LPNIQFDDLEGDAKLTFKIDIGKIVSGDERWMRFFHSRV